MKGLLIVCVFATLAVVILGCSSRCKTSCRGLPDGQYQSCKDCTSFIFCYGGKMGIFPCGCNTTWDDFFKRCEKESETCPTPTDNPCLTNCSGIPDGAYQACKDCHKFIVCHSGKTFLRKCPGGQEWDDSFKQCRPTSSTCPKPGPTPPTPGKRCVRSCTNVHDGDYQSCAGCHVYASCVAGKIYDNRKCPSNLVWDDFLKRCEYKSPTCPPGGKSPCMSNCTHQPNGTYQSCKGCDVFAKCENGKLTDGIGCKKGLVWDDAIKNCSKTSRTCNKATTDDFFLPSLTDYPCITNCTGLENGDYQSCESCHKFAMCSNNQIYILDCAAILLWDDKLKKCQNKSQTCPKLTGMF